MRRRNHKSTKVPGVKLRPADPSSSRRVRAISEDTWADETQWCNDVGDSDDHPFGINAGGAKGRGIGSRTGSGASVNANGGSNGFRDTCPRPLKGVVICATGVGDKPSLFKQAAELGAACTPAFTDRVTHLVAVGYGGAKYACAVERRIPILHPSWITDSYETWLRGDDVDLESSIASHKLSIFQDVVLCVCSASATPQSPKEEEEESQRLAKIAHLVQTNGGTFASKLERPVKVTHLLCSASSSSTSASSSAPTPDPKLAYAKKFNASGEAFISIVWETWFWDCLGYGGRCEEGQYDVASKPSRTRLTESGSAKGKEKANARDRSVATSLREGSRGEDFMAGEEGNEADPEAEPARPKLLHNVTLQLWSGLLARRGCAVNEEGELVVSPGKAKSKSQDQGMKFGQSTLGGDDRPRSVLQDIRRSVQSSLVLGGNGNGGGDGEPVAYTPMAIPFRRAGSIGMHPMRSDGDGGKGKAKVETGKAEDGEVDTSTLFLHATFLLLGEAKTTGVREAIVDAGGRVVSDVDGNLDVDYVVVRLVSGSKLFLAEADFELGRKYRTECWLEHCLFTGVVQPAEKHITFRPLRTALPLSHPPPLPSAHPSMAPAHPAFISFSTLPAPETTYLTRLLRALGLTIAPSFSKRTTVLVCPKREGQKYDKALEWGIPVVGMEWIEQVVRSVESKPSERSDAEERMGVEEAEESLKARDEGTVEDQEHTQDADQETFIPVQPSSLYSPAKSKSSIWNRDQAESASGSGRLDSRHSNGNGKTAESAPATTGAKSKLPAQLRGEPTMPCLDTDVIPSSRTPSPMWSNPQNSSHKPVALDPTLPSLSHPPSSSVSSGIQFPSSSKGQSSSSSSVSSKNQAGQASDLAERRASLSPVKVDLARTRALHDSITSLLGKRERLNSEMEVGSGDMHRDNAEGKQEAEDDDASGSMRQTRGRAAKASGTGHGKPAAKPKPRPKPKPKAPAKTKPVEQEQAPAEPEAAPAAKPKPKPRPRARGKAAATAAAQESIHIEANEERIADSPPPTKRSRPLRGKTNDLSSTTPSLPMEIQVDSQTLDEMNMDDLPEGQSLRVTYEDPSQRDERRRLLDLLGN